MPSTTATTTILPRSDGSSTFTTALGTTVLASVYGPMEVRARDEHPSLTFLEISARPSIGVSDTRQRALESSLYSALAPIVDRGRYPRSCVQINVQIVSEGGEGVVAAAVNAGVLALVDAGVPLKTVMVAAEVVGGGGRHTVAFDARGELVWGESEGLFEVGEWEEAVERGRRRCALGEQGGKGGRVGDVVRGAIEEKVRRDLRWRDKE